MNGGVPGLSMEVSAFLPFVPRNQVQIVSVSVRCTDFAYTKFHRTKPQCRCFGWLHGCRVVQRDRAGMLLAQSGGRSSSQRLLKAFASITLKTPSAGRNICCSLGSARRLKGSQGAVSSTVTSRPNNNLGQRPNIERASSPCPCLPSVCPTKPS